MNEKERRGNSEEKERRLLRRCMQILHERRFKQARRASLYNSE